MTRVRAVHELDDQQRVRRIRRHLQAHLVGIGETEEGFVEGLGLGEVRRRQHHVAEAKVAGDKARHALRRGELRVVAEAAMEQLHHVAGRVLEGGQTMGAAPLGGGGVSTRYRVPAHLQRRQAGLERGLVRQFPASTEKGILGARHHEEAERAVVRPQPKGTVRGVLHHETELVASELAPGGKVRGFNDQVAE